MPRPSIGQIHRQSGSTSSLHSFASSERSETRRKSLSETHIPEQPYYPTVSSLLYSKTIQQEYLFIALHVGHQNFMLLSKFDY